MSSPGAQTPHPLLLDLTLPTPAENLALDEALLLELDRAGSSHGEASTPARDGTGTGPPGLEEGREVLRFWESPTPFVVLGVSGRIAEEVDGAACAADGVPVLRRASGGGTVLQGPGCLNYSLVLSLPHRAELRDVTRGYALLLARVAGALERCGAPGARQEGTSDLAIAGLKLSGSAQKRTRRALLHHGTLLYSFRLEDIPRYLREPGNQPAYRDRRLHTEFVRNLDVPAPALKEALAREWLARPPEAPIHLPDLRALLDEKYLSRDWIHRF